MYRSSSFNSSGRSSNSDIVDDMYSDASLEEDVLHLNHKVLINPCLTLLTSKCSYAPWVARHFWLLKYACFVENLTWFPQVHAWREFIFLFVRFVRSLPIFGLLSWKRSKSARICAAIYLVIYDIEDDWIYCLIFAVNINRPLFLDVKSRNLLITQDRRFVGIDSTKRNQLFPYLDSF